MGSGPSFRSFVFLLHVTDRLFYERRERWHMDIRQSVYVDA